MSKKNTKVTADTAQTTNPQKPQSSLDGLKIEDVKTFKGLFTAWSRQVTDRNDPSKKITRFKCVCQVPTGETDDLSQPVRVDVSAWVPSELAAKHNIEHGTSFVGCFAYSDIRLESPRGQYNEERSLTNARLVAVLG